MPSPPLRFDLSEAIELALKMGAGLERDRPCERCVAAQRRLLEYFAYSAIPAVGFEIVKIVDGFEAANRDEA